MNIPSEISWVVHTRAKVERRLDRICPLAQIHRISKGFEAVCAKTEGLQQQMIAPVDNELLYEADCVLCLGKGDASNTGPHPTYTPSSRTAGYHLG